MAKSDGNLTMVANDILLKIIHLNAQYASSVDTANWQAWIDLFIDNCTYKIQPRENYDRHLPLCTLSLLSKAMLRDRVYGISNTLYHDPYYQRHIIGLPLITHQDEEMIQCETNYCVIRTKFSQASEVFNVGRYIDQLVISNHQLLIRSRICVFDSEMIPNSLIYPI